MPTEDLSKIYTEVVSEHARDPEHRHALPSANVKLKGRNPSCGDEITLELDLEDGIVKDASFEGVGCAISQASTDMMIDLIKGKPVGEAQALAKKFIGMIKGEITDEKELEELDEAMTLQGISHMPARVKCAVLAWHTLDEGIKEQKK